VRICKEFNSEHKWVRTVGKEGTKEGEFKKPQGVAANSSGDVYVVDSANNRVQEFNSEGKFIRMFGFGVLNGKEEAEVCTNSCQAGIAGSGNGQLSEPMGVTVDSSGDVWVVDRANDRVEEFNSEGKYLKLFGSKGTGENQFTKPYGITISEGNLYVVDEDNDRVEKFSTSGTDTELGHFGSSGSGNGDFSDPTWIATDPVSGDLYVTDSGVNHRIEKFSSAGGYLAKFGEESEGSGHYHYAEGVAVDNYGDVYLLTWGEKEARVEEWVPPATGNPSTHDTKTIYYSSAANSEYSGCGEHPALANLPCETTPAAQPGTSGLPELPVTKYTYNIWDEPETTTDTVGSTTRTKTETYDASGRLKTEAISSTVGTVLPTITDEYNKENGVLEKQCANEGKPCTEGKPKTITSIYNKLGQIESYTDAGEISSTDEYDIDGRVKKVNDGKGTETYTYSETTGLTTELIYEEGTTKLPFTGTYDVEGNILTEGYPNGMTATYTYNQVGKPTTLEYKKTTHCTEEKEKCKWFKDTVVPSIHGQWLEQTSTLSHQTYTYDNAGRLTQVQNTPTGKGCTTRIYAYDEDTNRTSLTTREPNSKGECATEGGTVERHAYDTADRLTDPGIAYNTFGDITTLPAKDAEESAAHELTNTYYTDNQVASQKQNEQTVGYNLDPADRTLETVSTGKPNNSTIISHYAGPSNEPSWTLNPVSNEWRRNITGIDGSLVAIQNNGETPELQLTNLHGDIIAKAYLSETATELAAKADTGEFGVPTVNAPAKYSWLGASELPTELPSGVISMGARSYVPEIGRFLQPDPVPGGSANAYSYTFGDPVNSSDPTGAYVEGAYLNAFNDTQNREAVEREEAREAAARAAAEQAAREAAEAAAAAAGPQYTGGEEEWEEWGEEEGGYEYASYDHGAKPEGEEHHIEPVLLVQSLGEEAGESEAGSTLGSVVSPCRADSKGPCSSNVIAGSPCIGSGSRCRPRHSGRSRVNVRIRTAGGGWHKVFDTYCGIVGGAALTPGVDVFDAPAAVGCAGYGVYRAVETIVEAL
jgi:RHS repeat-associated protein